MYGGGRGVRLVGVLAGAVGVALIGGVPALAGSLPRAGGVPVVIINGRGLGHGVGLAQDGAYWMGRRGASLGQILNQFYPGTALGGMGNPDVRVAVGDSGADTALSFSSGGQVTAGSGPQPLGFPVQVPPGGTAVVHQSGGAFTVTTPGGRTVAWSPSDGARVVLVSQPESSAGTASPTRPTTPTTAGGLLGLLPFLAPTTTTSPTTVPVRRPTSRPTTTTQPPHPATTAPPPPPTTTTVPTPGPVGGPIWAKAASGGTVAVAGSGHSYRGALELQASGSSVTLVNQVDVNDYLDGMGEVRDPSWPAASLEAQAVVARTYALRAMASAGELCADTRCQVYLGAQAEYPAMDQAVSATSGQVVLYGGGLAATVYSANAGGITATPQEGFGTNDNGAYPYLRAAPYPTQDPDPFHLAVTLAAVAARVGYPGTLTSVRIAAKGPSGRALVVALKGNAGTRTVSGLTFSDNLGLGSNLITLTGASAATAPAPPPPPTNGQALPSDAAALAAAAKAGAGTKLGGAPFGTVPGVATSPGLPGAIALGGGGTTPGTLAAGPLSPLNGSSGTRRPLVWSTLTLLVLVAAGEASLVAYRRVSLVPALRRSGSALVRTGQRLPLPGWRRRRRRQPEQAAGDANE